VPSTMFFGNFQILTFVLFSLFTDLEKCSSSETPSAFQTNVETAKNDLPITHDIFRRK